jgi:hypothetical protein
MMRLRQNRILSLLFIVGAIIDIAVDIVRVSYEVLD